MGLFRLLKLSKKEPPIRESEKPFYQPDSYYKDASYKGTEFEKKVIPFDERKKISYPSKRGLYVAEILLLKYCSYGTYPKPKTGYPGFWWYEYGIRNVSAKLESLEQRGFIKMNQASNKYELTDLGSAELFEDTGDIGALLEFWENLWANGGLKFNGSHWTFRLADLYIKIQQYDDALRAVKMIKNPAYKEKKAGYIEKIEKLSSKKKRKNSKNCKTV